MQFHSLKRTHKNKKARQIGRAGQRGKTSGRGTKGQNARAGHKKRPEIRDFIKRVPKMRGRGKNGNTSIQTKSFPINLGNIDKVFKAGEVVSTATLIKSGLLKKVSSKALVVKVLAGGKLTKKLTFQGLSVSESAKKAITDLGGEVK